MTEVQIRDKCSECDGVGVISNPDMATWVARYNAWHKAQPTYKTMDEYEAATGDVAPSWEEDACPNCEGRRMTIRWVSLAELARMIEAQKQEAP